MQFHGGAHCGNTAPRLTAAAEKMEILPPCGLPSPPPTTKTAKNRPTPVRGLLGAPRKPPAGHSCRTQHLGPGRQDYAPSERPSTADFALLRQPGVKFFSLVIQSLTKQVSKYPGMPETTSPSRGILRLEHNILCPPGCTGSAPPPHTISTGLPTHPVGAYHGTRRGAGSPKRVRQESRARIAPAKLRAAFDGNASKYPGTHCP